MRTVDSGSDEAHPVQGSLDDDILFRVDGTAYLVACPRLNAEFVTKTTELKAILETRCGTIVPGREDVLVSN